MGIYQNKSFDNFWTLLLDEVLEEGKAHFENAYSGSSFFEIYKDGAWERFDIWSDNTAPEKMNYIDWIKKWIETIIQEYESQKKSI